MSFSTLGNFELTEAGFRLEANLARKALVSCFCKAFENQQVKLVVSRCAAFQQSKRQIDMTQLNISTVLFHLIA